MDEDGKRRARGRPRGFDLDEALDRAIDVFWRRGYSGAGIAELSAAMRISPPSLYAAFDDKRGLFLAAVDRYATTIGAAPLGALRAAEGGGKLRAFLAASVRLAYDGERGRGCLVACVAADAAGDDDVVRGRLDDLMREHAAALDEAAGGMPSGRLLLAAMHAIAVRARAGATPDALGELARDLETQLLRRG